MEEIKPMDTQVDLATALLQPAPGNQAPNSNKNSSSSSNNNNNNTEQPVKVRKKPGRKPNPASPALRKAQNRAAQRAFRERKERHLRELEAAVKQMREQRDKLQAENDQLKSDSDILRSENWYLKGIVLTLQLVCFRHNLVIPQHSPYMNEEALSLMAQSIPEPISAYISVNANNKLPIPSSLQMESSIRKPRDRYLSSGSIVITKDGVRSVPESYPTSVQSPPEFVDGNRLCHTPTENLVHPHDLPNLSPVMETKQEPCMLSPPRSLAPEPLTSNLAAVQTLRLRLRLQSACAQMDSASFAIQPTILQLTIPHDPRIDLIPTPHMRDRMILFRDLFDLDDCFQCLIGNSVFHGGDPAVAANWELPSEFFDKFWFLTIDFSLQRMTNKWRRMQGLNELKTNRPEGGSDPQQQQQEQQTRDDSKAPTSMFTPRHLDEIAALLRSEQFADTKSMTTNYASSLVSDTSSSGSSCEDQTFFGPIHLTDGYKMTFNDASYTQPPWESANTPASLKDDDYEMMLDSLINTDEV